MEELLTTLSEVDLDPIASPVGIAVIVIGAVILLKAIKTAVKMAMLAVILIGVYVFLYGGNIGS